MIKSLIRVFKYGPQIIDALYIDDIDFHGIIYLYEDAKEYIKEISKAGNIGDIV